MGISVRVLTQSGINLAVSCEERGAWQRKEKKKSAAEARGGGEDRDRVDVTTRLHHPLQTRTKLSYEVSSVPTRFQFGFGLPRPSAF
jgi:hypothetical protein